MTDKQKIKILLNFIQYILDKWELNTKDTQDKALEILNKVTEA